jgi:hypothetical protein
MLRIDILRGDGGNNNPMIGTAATPVVQVRDGNGRPLAGALVVFNAPLSGATVIFAGFQGAATALTDDSGIAAASRLRPAGGNGPVEIRVTASHAGASGSAVIRQMNVGVVFPADLDQDLRIIALAAAAEPDAKHGRHATISVRVEDGKGQPAGSAKVTFSLRKPAPGHVPPELAQATLAAAANGEVTATLPVPARTSDLECMVRAEFHGHRATRFFPLTQ